MPVTVLIPATHTALTTVANVRADLGLSADDAPDAQIIRFIAQASARAASYCRRTFARETVRERFAGGRCDLVDAGGGLLLDRWPVGRIVGVTADTVVQAAETYETDGRYLYAVRAGERAPWCARVVVVDYEAGWLLPGEARDASLAPDLPDDVERAVIQLVGVALSTVGRDPLVKSEGVEGVGSTDRYVMGATSALAHPEAEAILADYRRLAFA